MISWTEARRVVGEAAYDAGVSELSDLEVTCFLSCLVSSVKLAAVNLLVDYRVNCTMLLSQTGPFDFAECPRFEIIRHVVGGTGLPINVCEEILDALENLILVEFEDSNSVQFEKIGTFFGNGSKCGLELAP